MSKSKPPKLIFVDTCDATIEIEPISDIIRLRCVDGDNVIYLDLDLSTAQSLKKHLGWIIYQSQKESNEG